MNSAPTVNVQEFINSQGFTAYQWSVLTLCFLVIAIDGFDTAAIGYIAPALFVDWHIAKSSLGPVLSAGLFGLALGATSSGPIADRLGRKTVLVLAVLFLGISSLASASSQSLEMLTILRFITGLGIGAAMPSAATLMAELAPDHHRSLVNNAMLSGFPLGAAGGGFLAAALIPALGWRSVLVAGGVLPIALGIVLIFRIPESVRYMVAKGAAAERIHALLDRIAPGKLVVASQFVIGEETYKASFADSVKIVLARPYIVGTLMLWLAYFMGLVIFYLLTNSLPILIHDSGHSVSHAALITALFPLGGGIGALASGWLMDRFNPNLIVSACFFATGLFTVSIGYGAPGLLALIGLIFMAGTTMNGAQASMSALAANYYPTRARATGIAWMMGVGRFGAIVGALAAAELLRRRYGLNEAFIAAGLPALFAATALFVNYLAGPRRKAVQTPSLFDAPRDPKND
ncbi:AAHS family 4-hydroxybenzoate transporter-like MFS transporter [Paraburkholderia sp. GAS448]|uniref:MFS transporter n=1 Tax=Paraburkholderia sp. GAS448 TaxID=3035136 RepID=UPI003D1BE234